MSKLEVFAKTLADLGHKRFRKNPRVYPKAKSKLLKVRQPTPVDPEEDELCRKWWTDYRLQYEATSKLFAYEIYRQKMEAMAISRTDHEHERNRRQELTEHWNRETQLAATDKLEELLKLQIEKQNIKITEFMNKETVFSEKLQADLAAIKMLSEQMITEENLDEKIDEIMNSDVVDYNFIVDHKGNIIRGSKPLQQAKSAPSTTGVQEEEESVQNDHPMSVTS
uniref:Small ribosomal subunit protein mS26 n=1 Tax=Trichobilharzia regenti TaxID=157069 RepID=A0AA85KJ43_TRIRE|nr:unnamed protein product [Trichobilharzia regenti]